MKRLSILFACLAGAALAQADYTAVYEADLAGAASVVTVQAPASNAARIVRFQSVYIFCSIECEVTLERSGAAATATALVPTPLNPTTAAAKSKVWRSSNVGTGTVIGVYTLPAGATLPVDLALITLSGSGTTKNLTVRTSAITGIARIAIQFREEI